MLAPISNARKDGGSSFRKLKQYITVEKDPVTGKEKFRGEYLLSENLLSIETAHREMAAVAVQNPRVKDPIYHFQICWSEGEQPTREQWRKAVLRCVEELGYGEHQFVAAAHENTKVFHVHVMVNRVHPETYRPHYPRQDMPTLDKVMRELENEGGWKEANGFYRWDSTLNEAVRNTREEMAQRREANADERARGDAAKIEHYNDVESFQNYARHSSAKELKQLLAKSNVTWQDVHQLLAFNGLKLEKAEKGGYTVCSTNQDIRAKASTVFRETFAGKANREQLDKKLGPWQAPTGALPTPGRQYSPAPKAKPQPVRDPERREAQRAKREEERKALRTEFFKYRSDRRKEQKAYTAKVREQRKTLSAQLRAKKADIRAKKSLTWQEKRAALSVAAAETVIEQKLLSVRARRERLAMGAQTYQQWVSSKAAEGDKRAIAQLRGWRYQDQRNVRRMEKEITEGSRTDVQVMSADPSDVAAWEYLSNDDVRAMEHAEVVAQRMAQMRVSIDRGNGNVAYLLQGKTALVDRGKAISVMSKDEAATVLALEMAVKKYGSRIVAQGSEQWRKEIAAIAAKHNIFIEFVDPMMQRTMTETKVQMQSRSTMANWTMESGGLASLGDAARKQAEKDYAKWAAANPKVAQQLPLALYVEQGQSPRAVELRLQAERWLLMRESVLKAQSRIEFQSDTAAREFLQALYGKSAAHVFQSRVTALQPGTMSELNIRNICVFTVAADRDGKKTYRIMPADQTRARQLSDDLAAVLQQSAKDAQRQSITPTVKVAETQGKGRRSIGR